MSDAITLIGRDTELARAAAALDQAVSGRARPLAITGEAGIGKTRLADEIAAMAGGRAGRAVWGRWWGEELSPPYEGWTQVAAGLGGSLDIGNTPPAVAGELSAMLRTAGGAVHLLLVVLDDLHLADEPSLRVLSRLTSLLAESNVLLCGTFRDEELEPGSVRASVLTRFARDGERIALGGLEGEAIAHVYEQVTGVPGVPPVVRSIEKASAGNPFFVRELAMQFSTKGELHRPQHSVGIKVPASVQELIGERLDRLGAETRGVLSAAAVLGMDFDVGVLSTITEVGPDALDAALERARAGRVIGEVRAPGRLSFRHLLLREALYESTRLSVRRRLHAAAATAISAGGDVPDRMLPELAHHLFKAGDEVEPPRAIDSLLAAARYLTGRGATEDAERALARARDLAASANLDLGPEFGAFEASPPDASPSAGSPETATGFVKEGEFWTLLFEGEVARVKDSKGLRQIARLLRHPGTEIAALDLAGEGGLRGTANRQPRLSTASSGGLEALDPEARRAYKTRITELHAELQEAEEMNDPERAGRARTELDFITTELAHATGLGGRERRAGDDADRARSAVTRAIRSAVARIEEVHPALGGHLRVSIRTGIYCSYAPEPRARVAWRVQT